MSDFNKIMAFQQISPYLSKENREELAITLGMDLSEIERRLIGKNKEDEFVLILLFMNVCKSITGFDEGVSQLMHTATSDLLVELKSNDKFMLEIKHTDKERYSISMGNLQKRIDYANTYNLDLYFAISIKGYWMLFKSDYLISKHGKIEVSDMTKSKLDEVLGCVSYVFPKDLRIKSVYSTDENVKTTEIQFDPYGKMVSYELYCGKKKIFRVKGKNSPFIACAMALEALQDRLSMEKQEIEQVGQYTIINESFSHEFNAISEYEFLIAPIEHTTHNGNEKYDVHTYIENAKADKKTSEMHFDKEHIRNLMHYLANNGVELMYIKNNKIYKMN